MSGMMGAAPQAGPPQGQPMPGPPQQAQPIGNNVVPFPPPQGGPMPGMVPNPAYQQWVQQAQKVQAVVAANRQKQQQFEAAVALMKKDGIHGFKLDIEADSTIAPDEQAEQQARTELLGELLPMLQQIVPVAQGNPPLAALAKELVLFGLRSHKVGRPLEESIEQAFDAIAQMPPNPKATGQQPGKGGQGGNPAVEAAKVQADVHDTEQKAQTERMAIAQKAQQAQIEASIAQQRAAAEDQHTQAELMLSAAELQQRERLSNARVAALGARQSQGLV